ncbi:MAG: DUF192 domain-containing protein [Caulobacteraceae bacterium]
MLDLTGRFGHALRRFLPTLAVLALLPVAPAHARPDARAVEPLEIVTTTGAHRFKVEVARTDASRERGLMFRKSLAADRGMLFDFRTPRPVAFWMKNTLIPLDMVFIGADGRIVRVAERATPLSETPIPSGGDVLGVLELRGGRAAQIDARPGDRVRQSMFPP